MELSIQYLKKLLLETIKNRRCEFLLNPKKNNKIHIYLKGTMEEGKIGK
jgi:hypothetical protein